MSKIILFVSAFVPMYAVFFLILLVEIINNNLRWNITNRVVFVTLIVLMLVGIVGLIWLIKKSKKRYKHIKIISQKNVTDEHFLNYFSLFVLLALTFDLSKICFIFALALILIFIGVVYIRNNIFYVNPLLNILGYSFYDIVFEEEGKEKELRIFYKGELVAGDYKLFTTHKNLYFVERFEKKEKLVDK